MADFNNTSYEYTVNKDGTITYVAGCDGAKQTLSNLKTPQLDEQGIPVVIERPGEAPFTPMLDALQDVDTLKRALDGYTTAYINGLREEEVNVGDGIHVGKAVKADANA